MIPTLTVKLGTPLVDVIVELGHAKSKAEARRLIEQGAVKLTKYVHEHVDVSGPGAH